jgi:C4-type Zn-finger protein
MIQSALQLKEQEHKQEIEELIVKQREKHKQEMESLTIVITEQFTQRMVRWRIRWRFTRSGSAHLRGIE